MRIGDSQLDEERLQALCRKWKITRLSLFGSALANRQNATSDVDLLVDFTAEESWSLMDLARAEQEFAELIGRPVELVDRSSLLRSANWIRRDAILNSAKAIYGP